MSPRKTPDTFSNDNKYAKLSHCWGEWGPKGIPVLKSENEEERFREGVCIDAIPPTFHDAIRIAEWFQGQIIEGRGIPEASNTL